MRAHASGIPESPAHNDRNGIVHDILGMTDPWWVFLETGKAEPLLPCDRVLNNQTSADSCKGESSGVKRAKMWPLLHCSLIVPFPYFEAVSALLHCQVKARRISEASAWTWRAIEEPLIIIHLSEVWSEI